MNDPRESLTGLYAWYRRRARRLPFRGSRDPYRIWVSEVMLQQTRMSVVVPRFEEFMKRFPSMETLAAASEADVVAQWRGLGYYSRARNLRRGAQAVVERFDGAFPREEANALSLPGVGAYTAAAVLSICYGRPLPVLDGNVRRVLQRLYARRNTVEPGERVLRERATELMAARGRTRPGTHNQALMELGALRCTVGLPDCAPCPLRPGCGAFRLGGPEEASRLPAPRKKRAAVQADWSLLVALDKDEQRVLIARDPGTPLLAGLWFFPAILSGPGLRRATPGLEALREEAGTHVGARRFRHTITHHLLQGRAEYRSFANLDRALRRVSRAAGAAAEWSIVSRAELPNLVVSSVADKLLG